MINPQPVKENRSPYSAPVASGNTPPPISPSNLPQSPVPEKPRHKRWKRTVGLIFIALLVGASTYAIASYFTLKNSIIVTDDTTKNSAILGYDPNSNASPDSSKFTMLGDGRFNVVFVGIDQAAGLTDSIQVLSIDTINKQSSITSIPRDLYVTVPGYGRTKINAAYNIAEQKKAGSGSSMLKQVVGNVVGTTITNYALINFTGLQDVVNSIGGVDVTVPKAISDPLFPCPNEVDYCPFYITAGLHHLDGSNALKYSRSRETTSDFDRSARQQLVIEAIRQKALSAGVLTNPLKINSILQALGHSFRTDLQLDQIKTLIGIYDSIPETSKHNYVLDTTTALGLLTSSSDTAAGYISYPILGVDHFTAIQQWFHKNNPDPLLEKENPTITIANGGKATAKQMADLAALLTDYGYTVTTDTTYISKTRATVNAVYTNHLGAKPITQNYLATQFATSVQTGSPLSSSSDFELIYAPATTSSTPIPTPSPVTEPPSN